MFIDENKAYELLCVRFRAAEHVPPACVCVCVSHTFRRQPAGEDFPPVHFVFNSHRLAVTELTSATTCPVPVLQSSQSPP